MKKFKILMYVGLIAVSSFLSMKGNAQEVSIQNGRVEGGKNTYHVIKQLSNADNPGILKKMQKAWIAYSDSIRTNTPKIKDIYGSEIIRANNQFIESKGNLYKSGKVWARKSIFNQDNYEDEVPTIEPDTTDEKTYEKPNNTSNRSISGYNKYVALEGPHMPLDEGINGLVSLLNGMEISIKEDTNNIKSARISMSIGDSTYKEGAARALVERIENADAVFINDPSVAGYLNRCNVVPGKNEKEGKDTIYINIEPNKMLSENNKIY